LLLILAVLSTAAASPAQQPAQPPAQSPAVPAQAGLSHPAKPGPAPVNIALVSRDAVETRLRSAPRNNADREPAIEKMFAQAGCGDSLQEQPVKHEQFPNVVCRLAGTSDSVIIVGAHFDKVRRGGGVVDNWSGASLLPSLFQSLRGAARRHTFLFIAFTAEEEGLIGSKYYVSHMTPDEVARTHAMVNIDTLALGPTKIWLTHSDRQLAADLFAVARSMNLPIGVVNADHVGDDDSSSFMRRRIPTLMIHSITNPTFHILHTDDDNLSAVRFGDYYDSYRLIAADLAWLDGRLE
jgi:Peptidase family M28